MLALISLLFIVAGYLLVAALWYLMVYRPSRRDARGHEPDADRPGERLSDAT